MSRFAGGGQSWVLGKLGLSAESAGEQAAPSLAPPWHLFVPAQEPAPAPGQSASLLHGPPLFEPALQVGLQTGQLWIPGAFGKRSPVRKSSELSGRLRLEPPLPLPTPVVKLNWDGCGLRPKQVWSVVVVVDTSVVVVTSSVVVVPASVVVVTASVVVVPASVVVVPASVVVVPASVVVVPTS